MALHIFDVLRGASALLVGGAIGLVFGTIQQRARRRHERLQQEGKFTTGWAATPGSFRRVAYLLVALALVQLVCPLLFAPGSACPWYVSAGVLLGYGRTLLSQLRERRT